MTSNQLLYKYVKAMIADRNRKDKSDVPKSQPYNDDLAELERFIR